MKQQYKKVQYKDYTGIVTGNQENTNGVQLGDIYHCNTKRTQIIWSRKYLYRFGCTVFLYGRTVKNIK